MIRFLSLILVILSFSSAYCQDRVDGWGKVKWGMKPEEVSKAYDGKVTQIKDKKTDDINYLLSLKDPITIADFKFEVRFSFDNEKRLNAVNLSGSGASSIVFDKVYNMMLTKYKSPLKDEKKKATGAVERKVFWSKDTTSIQLIFVELSTGYTFVALLYRSVKGGSGAENL